MNDETAAQPPQPTREEEIARKAARFVKASKPQLKRLMESTRPTAENAGKEAARYVREHESELKDAALKLAQARLGGPIGMVVASMANGLSQGKSAPVSACVDCGTVNPPAANFCNECGTRLTPQTAPS